MKIHWFQHVPFEDLGAIEAWLTKAGHTLSRTRLHAGESPPESPEGFDWLIVMGGPMNVSQHREHPWLRAEKRAILDAIAAGKRLLGVCLGAQLIADVLGGTVSKNREREIGWFPVRSMPGGAASPFAFPDETAVFHWHAETFSLPPGGVLLAASAGCANQAFAFGRNVLALQFHLEMTATEIGRIARECAGELTPGRYVQSADEMIASAAENEPATSALLDRLLTALEKG